MHAVTREVVDSWWAELFGIAREQLWREVTVQHPHGHLGDYAGWYVAWRDGGVHVSAPSTAEAEEVASLRDASGPDLQDPAFWEAFARQRGLELRGPAMHAYLDVDPGPAPGVVDVDGDDLETLRSELSADDWEAWSTPDPVHPVAVVEAGRIVAAASLGPWLGHVVDVGVVVVPDRRGRGLAATVGQSCASYAIRQDGLALWRAALSNVASVRSAERLGFEVYATQVALRA